MLPEQKYFWAEAQKQKENKKQRNVTSLKTLCVFFCGRVPVLPGVEGIGDGGGCNAIHGSELCNKLVLEVDKELPVTGVLHRNGERFLRSRGEAERVFDGGGCSAIHGNELCNKPVLEEGKALSFTQLVESDFVASHVECVGCTEGGEIKLII